MAKTSLGFESMTGHRNHLAVLWALVIFVLLTVLITTYGGQMEKLPEREFPKTQIHGDLTVNDDLIVKGSLQVDGAALSSFYTNLTARVAGATSALLTDSFYLTTFTGNATVTYTLPPAKQGSRLSVYLKQEPDNGTDVLTFDCAGSDAFKTGSIVQSTDTNNLSTNVSTAGQTILKYTPVTTKTNMLGGGSRIDFSCVNDGFWQVYVEPKYGVSADPGTAFGGALEFAA